MSINTEREVYKHIKYSLIPHESEYLVTKLNKYQANMDLYMYYMFRFLGLCAAFNTMYPKQFKEIRVNLIDKPNECIKKLYDFLLENKGFENVKGRFKELRAIISTFFVNK